MAESTITIAEIRAAINIPETSELSDIAITSAITRAYAYLTVLGAQYSAPAEYFPPCEMAYAAYLAYQTYADRVLNVPHGSYQEGQWSPIAEEIVRDTNAKLQGIRTTYKDYEKIIKSFPVKRMGRLMSSSSRPRQLKFGIGQHDNPSSCGYSITGYL